MTPTEDQIFQYYQGTFKKIYGDLVAVVAYKPLQISFELEAMISHIAVAKTSSEDEIVKKNLSRAEGHMHRATLDAAKILWLEYRERAQPVLDDDMARKYCTLVSEAAFISAYNAAEKLAIDARRSEIENVGIDPAQSASKFYEAANAFRNLWDMIDWDRVESIKKFRFWYTVRQQLIGFFFGILASAIVAVLAWKYLPPPS